MSKVTVCCCFAVLGVAPFSQVSHAQTRGQQPLDGIMSCRAIEEEEARLSCFDRATSELATATATGRVAVVDRALARERGQRGFGLSSARKPNARSDDLSTATEVKSTIGSVRANAGLLGRWDLTLANGMMWQSLETPIRIPQSGEAITVRRVRLGGYRASVDGSKLGFLVKRLR